MPRVVSILTGLCLLVPSVSTAAEAYCPKKMAAIRGIPVSESAVTHLAAVYKKLGCALKVDFLPGKRAIFSYNKGTIDGEVIRLPVVERYYTKPFIRSTVPLYSSFNAIWQHPDNTVANSKPRAAVRGASWHDAYIREHPEEKIVQFNTFKELGLAYKNGTIGSFLSSEASLKAMGSLEPHPALVETLAREKFYHYLSPEYKRFMADFSKALKQNNPFKAKK